MGWDYCIEWKTKQHVVDYLTRTWERIYPKVEGYTSETIRNTSIKHTLKGNTLWIIREVITKETQEKRSYIECVLISYGRRDKCYGYKAMDESMGPYYYDCPLSFLKLAPVANQKWRDTVIAYHKEKADKKLMKIIGLAT